MRLKLIGIMKPWSIFQKSSSSTTGLKSASIQLNDFVGRETDYNMIDEYPSTVLWQMDHRGEAHRGDYEDVIWLRTHQISHRERRNKRSKYQDPAKTWKSGFGDVENPSWKGPVTSLLERGWQASKHIFQGEMPRKIPWVTWTPQRKAIGFEQRNQAQTWHTR